MTMLMAEPVSSAPAEATKVSETVCTKLTPRALARRYGVAVEKVLHWIKTGQLRAINAAKDLKERPRFLIDVADVADFEQRRTAIPDAPQPQKRRMQTAGVKKFF